MQTTLPAIHGLEVRRSISQIRHEIESTTLAYRTAKDARQGREAVALLRKRSELIMHLLDVQREFFRLADTENGETVE